MKPDYISTPDYELLKQKYPNNLDEILEKLKNNYPVQYLIGYVDFYDCCINVNENVLIPRYETEYLIEKIIKKVKKMNIEPCKIIDLGTGSGCIAISLKKNLNCTMKAIDISPKALELAKENALHNNVDIIFLNNSIEEINLEGYDIIVSNPPYVSLDEEVDIKTKHEPQNAIFTHDNGLYFYKIIIDKISELIEKPKLIAFEIGMNQGDIIIDYAKNKLSMKGYSIEKDLTNRDRYIFVEL